MGALPVLTVYLCLALAANHSGTIRTWESLSPQAAPEPLDADVTTADPALPPDVISPVAKPILPEARKTGERESGSSINWAGVYQSSARFLAVEHGFRLLTEPGTRSGLKGSFIRNYWRSVSNLHGWADGDEFYVNYVGHPMQGSVAGFLWAHNDLRYRRAEFGTDPIYWKARL